LSSKFPTIAVGSQNTQNYLTLVALAVGDIVALDNTGMAVKANQAIATQTVIGVSTNTTTGGSLQTVVVQTRSLFTFAGYTFTPGPVYVLAGALTQNVALLAYPDKLIVLGLAVTTSQVQVGVQPATELQLSATSVSAPTSALVFQELQNRPKIATAGTVGKLAVFSAGDTLASADSLTIPSQGGTILTDQSKIDGTDFS